MHRLVGLALVAALVASGCATTQEVAGAPSVRRLRSSIWIRRDGRWRLAFHQGTPVP